MFPISSRYTVVAYSGDVEVADFPEGITGREIVQGVLRGELDRSWSYVYVPYFHGIRPSTILNWYVPSLVNLALDVQLWPSKISHRIAELLANPLNFLLAAIAFVCLMLGLDADAVARSLAPAKPLGSRQVRPPGGKTDRFAPIC